MCQHKGVRAERRNSPLLGLHLLFKLVMEQMRPTHIRKSNLLYSVYHSSHLGTLSETYPEMFNQIAVHPMTQ